ncbi:DExH-box splicing factor binding site-domain-containing protein [Astrocystis sublimbata]|nr:DExH-box splicing factor binding site-domain-containing protein [Astrocystis sublimbata]
MTGATPHAQAPRIAIKFAASSSATSRPSSNATNRRGQPQPSSALGKRQRPNALQHDSDSGEDDDAIGKHESVTIVGADNDVSNSRDASDAKRRKEYVISSQKNRDWKADAKRRNGGRSHNSDTSSNKNPTQETAPADHDTDIKWGLNVTTKPTHEDAPKSNNDSQEQGKRSPDEDTLRPHSPVDVDKDAIDALLGKRKPAQQLIIKDSAGSNKPQFSEKDAYHKGVEEAADVSTIEEYDEIPEGEFGAAMLRGMGWKGEEIGSKPKEATRRPHLMGLGSKEDEEIRKGELARRNGHRERRPRLDEYRREREKEKERKNARYGDSHKSDREHERREKDNDRRHRSHHRERDERGYRR